MDGSDDGTLSHMQRFDSECLVRPLLVAKPAALCGHYARPDMSQEILGRFCQDFRGLACGAFDKEGHQFTINLVRKVC